MNIEGPITIEEAGITLKNMPNNKSPGSTGFTTEFFKFFWKDLGHFVVKSLNYRLEKGELSTTQKEGIVTCIPKGNKSKKYIKNWRPISLLNISYKIASGCIARRIKKVLPSIIDLDQSGFMSGRFTGDNIRLIYDTLNFSSVHKKRGLLLLIDFEKAFDSVAWSFIKKSLLFYNFKSDIIAWIGTFYNGIKSSVIVNNSPTQWFPIERGCRQGDPISPYIFLLCGEVLAHMIRQNENIKGYSVNGKEIKLSQFADDTSLLLDGSPKSFETCVYTILEYAKYSGLAMNFDKTKVVWFGCEHPPNITYLPHLPFEWNPRSFTILGVEFTTDLRNITDNNINKKLIEMQKELNSWSKRDLTPFGKVTVIKSLVLSKIVHLLISLPSPSDQTIKEINKMLYSFLWDGKPDKMKRSLAKQKALNGGIAMIDVSLFDKALKLTWIRRLFIEESKWKIFIEGMHPNLTYIREFGNQFVKKMYDEIKNPFWKCVLSSLYTFNKSFKLTSMHQIKACSFLFNDQIKVGGRVVNNKKLTNGNVFFIKQLMHNERFLTYNEFIRRYNLKINFMNFNSVICAIKKYISGLKLEETTGIEFTYQPSLQLIVDTPKGASAIYNTLVEPYNQNKGYEKWKFAIQITTKQWQNSFKNVIATTSDTKLRWLQFRILHNILTTNYSVSKFKREQTPLCEFCNLQNETIHHLF